MKNITRPIKIKINIFYIFNTQAKYNTLYKYYKKQKKYLYFRKIGYTTLLIYKENVSFLKVY